jgi:hypothetical protein
VIVAGVIASRTSCRSTTIPSSPRGHPTCS